MINNNLLHVTLNKSGQLTRRSLLQLAGGGFAAMAGAGILKTLGLSAAEMKRQGRACIMVFLSGAPSQLETWDPKPGNANGGPTKAIATKIAGVQFAEYWPKLAGLMNDMSVIRSIAGKEAAHERGRFHLRTGHRMGPTKFPHFGSVVANRLGDPDSDMPNFVSIGNTLSSGFLGVKVAPFIIDKAGELPYNVKGTVDEQRRQRRLQALALQDQDFGGQGASQIAQEHIELYRRASELMTSSRLNAFTLNGESDKVKNDYGANAFGQSCLVARRLVENGVPFVEVQRGGWDMHQNLWQSMPKTAGEVDQGVSALITDLKARGLLEQTVVVVVGEFGRTPKINQRTPSVGRDHWSRNFNGLIAGGGMKGGVCVGKTSDDGMEIADRPVEVDDLFASMCRCLKIDQYEEMITPEGRPIRIVDNGSEIGELFS
ncbi:MAG: DUF1501 domain-containing protein [Planctomycetaceae bacterium]|nr:DUF1501 domain-containing protein [Planctomycetaceae bacterium]MCB9949841.1 DUF1501 domain-containing protein [Planctomycetaceae bacterium]